MKRYSFILAVALLAATLLSCDERFIDVPEAIEPEDFPFIVIVGGDEEGELEDTDEVEFAVTLADRLVEGELDGAFENMPTDVTVDFTVSLDQLPSGLSYFAGDPVVFYEIDDDTESADQLISWTATAEGGSGSFIFPAEAEEMVILFTVDPVIVGEETDNGVIDPEDRVITFEIAGITGGENTVAHTDTPTEFLLLDDEKLYGTYTFDPATELDNVIAAFSLIAPDLEGLTAADIAGNEIEFKFDEMSIVVETIGGDEIEIDLGYDEFPDGMEPGDDAEEIVFEEDIEAPDGVEYIAVYEGTIQLVGADLTLVLVGEFNGAETDEITLSFTKD